MNINLTPICTTRRGWECVLARRADGACWVVVHDGLSEHEGPLRDNIDDAVDDVPGVVEHLEGLARFAKFYAMEGPN